MLACNQTAGVTATGAKDLPQIAQTVYEPLPITAVDLIFNSICDNIQ